MNTKNIININKAMDKQIDYIALEHEIRNPKIPELSENLKKVIKEIIKNDKKT